MILRLSRFAHMIPIAEGRFLVVDAISQARLVVNGEVAAFIGTFAEPQTVPEPLPPGGVVAAMVERGLLTEHGPDEELADVAATLAPYHGRDPDALLQKFRREAKEGADPYWAVAQARGLAEFGGGKTRVDLVLLGDCDVHMEADFLRREAAARGLDLRVAATFPDDVRFAGEHRHDAVLVGALRSRHSLTDPQPADGAAPPHAGFLAEARTIIEGLRRHTAAPILIDGLPEPTVQPMGFADRGPLGHRGRFRVANLALSALVESFPDTHMVDLAAALGAAGAERLLDDGLSGFTHMGSPGWMLQRAEEELAPVHGQFPDLAPLADWLGGDPYGREAVAARAHLDALAVVLGLDAKKCVVVDLDGLLWPGVLAETGSPFAWTPQDNPHSYIGLYFGLHEALLTLKRRGVLLACVSKNDEATVRALWTYPAGYPRALLTPDDFVTLRINWGDKVENIRSIADELGLAPETFLFLDDNPVERDRVRQRLPQVEVWGDDPFSLRRRLLNDPRLQQPRLTSEAAGRTELAKAQLGRQAARAGAVSESDFIASLNVQSRIERLAPGAALERIVELFQRTTQFNATGIKFTAAELDALLRRDGGAVYAMQVSDRFADHGLVGAAVLRDGEIVGLALSCRVLGIGVEHRLLQAIIAGEGALTARITPTDRNAPVRNIYRDNGFTAGDDGVWRCG
ncbi:MAG TPA: HAD-IIIC family phosphatase [Phenylobacterium sp.]|jgi:FkbH-like protein|uniref:HAD-IIIC family phosphatase n=1 Tax=Phenylobacterium sp. TaxID=1871053 RepID=UPI002B584B96|nr:HAD-IIIC family phosphatase [Phenylobacterium sp.]HXA41090.1 HAD-IIIC family phosphatase [Phenylobacterium sp.]